MLVKIHHSYRDVIAICDSELIGKKIEEGEFQLDLTGAFFDGDEKTKEEVLELMRDAQKEDATFNIIGKEAVQCALECRVIDKEGIREIQGVPFALVLL